jgi:hypothetical protein
MLGARTQAFSTTARWPNESSCRADSPGAALRLPSGTTPAFAKPSTPVPLIAIGRLHRLDRL